MGHKTYTQSITVVGKGNVGIAERGEKGWNPHNIWGRLTAMQSSLRLALTETPTAIKLFAERESDR